jgi:hypothetical protein
VPGEPENQFSLIRAALSTGGRAKSKFLSVRGGHGVRLLGNQAAHDPESIVTVADARDVLEFTEALLIYIYALDHRYAEFQKRRTETPKS